MYSSLFHQCIAGPIVRYETVADEIDSRKVSQTDVYVGIRRFCIGLAKKAILANSCASAADTLLQPGVEALSAQSSLGLWLGMLFYMLQIYLDFSAYSDMAIGMGTNGRLSLSGELQLSLYGKFRTGFLAEMAHFLKYLFPGIMSISLWAAAAAPI